MYESYMCPFVQNLLAIRTFLLLILYTTQWMFGFNLINQENFEDIYKDFLKKLYLYL